MPLVEKGTVGTVQGWAKELQGATRVPTEEDGTEGTVRGWGRGLQEATRLPPTRWGRGLQEATRLPPTRWGRGWQEATRLPPMKQGTASQAHRQARGLRNATWEIPTEGRVADRGQIEPEAVPIDLEASPDEVTVETVIQQVKGEPRTIPAHVQAVYEAACKRCRDAPQRALMADFLQEYRDVINQASGDAGHTSLVKHDNSVVEGKWPICQSPHRLEPHKETRVESGAEEAGQDPEYRELPLSPHRREATKRDRGQEPPPPPEDVEYKIIPELQYIQQRALENLALDTTRRGEDPPPGWRPPPELQGGDNLEEPPLELPQEIETAGGSLTQDSEIREQEQIPQKETEFNRPKRHTREPARYPDYEYCYVQDTHPSRKIERNLPSPEVQKNQWKNQCSNSTRNKQDFSDLFSADESGVIQESSASAASCQPSCFVQQTTKQLLNSSKEKSNFIEQMPQSFAVSTEMDNWREEMESDSKYTESEEEMLMSLLGETHLTPGITGSDSAVSTKQSEGDANPYEHQ